MYTKKGKNLEKRKLKTVKLSKYTLTIFFVFGQC